MLITLSAEEVTEKFTGAGRPGTALGVDPTIV
jgi:hypothetical protein